MGHWTQPRAFLPTTPRAKVQPRAGPAQKNIFLLAFPSSGRREWYNDCDPTEGLVIAGPREWLSQNQRPCLMPHALCLGSTRASSLGLLARRPPLVKAGLGKLWNFTLAGPFS